MAIDFQARQNSSRGFIIDALLEDAECHAAEGQTSIAFCVLWMSFNAWGSLVTSEDTDARMIEQLSNESRLQEKFADLLKADDAFRNSLHEFASYWPIFSNSDIGLWQLWPEVEARFSAGRASTAQYLKGFDNKKAARKKDITVGGVRRAPKNDSFDVSQPTWPDLLETLYAVRNNVMHGTKGFDYDDAAIIRGSYDSLHGVVRAMDLYHLS